LNTFVPVTPHRHRGRWWQPETSYAWVSAEPVVPLAGSEMVCAALHMPLAFIRPRGAFLPAAVMGLEPGVNLFVNGDGRWTAGYIPALLRSRPFALVALPDGRKVLCVDEEAARVSDRPESPQAQPFFDADEKPTSRLQECLKFLSALEASRQLTAKACADLERHKLLVPWNVHLRIGGITRELAGLYRIDEAALLALPDGSFLELRRASALTLAYAQLLSIGQAAPLGERANARLAALQQATVPVTAGGDLDLSFLERGGTLHSSW
jgi:hypothetical protein